MRVMCSRQMAQQRNDRRQTPLSGLPGQELLLLPGQEMLYVLQMTVHAKFPSLTVLSYYSAFKGTAKFPAKTAETPTPPAAALAQDGSGRPTAQGQSDSRFLRFLLTQIDLLA